MNENFNNNVRRDSFSVQRIILYMRAIAPSMKISTIIQLVFPVFIGTYMMLMMRGMTEIVPKLFNGATLHLILEILAGSAAFVSVFVNMLHSFVFSYKSRILPVSQKEKYISNILLGLIISVVVCCVWLLVTALPGLILFPDVVVASFVANRLIETFAYAIFFSGAIITLKYVLKRLLKTSVKRWPYIVLFALSYLGYTIILILFFIRFSYLYFLLIGAMLWFLSYFLYKNEIYYEKKI